MFIDESGKMCLEEEEDVLLAFTSCSESDGVPVSVVWWTLQN